MRWFERLFRQKPVAVVTLPPDGVEPRGFHGKNAFADQFNLLGSDIRVVFDVGANTGQTTERYLELFPEAMIYGFEPFPEAYTQFSGTFAQHSRVKAYHLAIADAVGSCALHTYTNSVTNSLLPPDSESHRFVAAGQMDHTGVITAETTTIDEFCHRENIKRINILKFDIQGGEGKALRGAADTLRARRVDLIYTEMMFVPVYQGQYWFFNIAADLHHYGYRLFDFYNFAYAETGQLKWGDAIFLPT